jgi:alpha/beta superfamily hydrolase
VSATSTSLDLSIEGRQVQAVLDLPDGEARGLAVVAHPHPLFGGTMDNKVVQTLARACVATGWQCLRFNFRGVGSSEGVYDEGHGESQDLVALVEQLAPEAPLVLAGFSFGAFVTCQAVQALWPTGRLKKIMLVGTAVSHFPASPLPLDAHEHTLVIHGESDDTVALSAVMDWARPQQLPVMVFPGTGHFFHGQLPLLKSLAMRHLRA